MVPTTWNPSDKSAAVVLSNGNLTASIAGSVSGYNAVRSVDAVSTGKYYWEIEIDATSGSNTTLAGICTAAFVLTNHSEQQTTGWIDGAETSSAWAWTNNVNTLMDPGTSGMAPGDVFCIALDADAGSLWFGKNGTWFNSGNPGVGTSPIYTGLSGPFYAVAPFLHLATARIYNANFGSTAMAYTVPSGFNSGFGDVDVDGDIAASFSITTQGYGNFVANPSFPLFVATLTGSDNLIHINSSTNIPVFLSNGSLSATGQVPQPGVVLLGSLPAIYGALYGGGIASFNLKTASFAAHGIVALLGELALSMNISFNPSSQVIPKAVLGALLTHMAFSGAGKTGILANIDKGFLLSLSATGVVGVVGDFAGNISFVATPSLNALVVPHGDGTFSLVFTFGATGFASTALYKALVMNLQNYGLTEYLNYNFNSLVAFDGKSFGVNSTGIYELTGSQDVTTDIPWRILTPRFDLETDGVRKLLRQAWLGYSASGDLIMTVILPDGNTYDYDVESTDIVDGGVRVKFGKGIRTRYVELELKNAANESIILDKFRIFTDTTGTQR